MSKEPAHKKNFQHGEGAEVSGQSQNPHDLTEKTECEKGKSSSAGPTDHRLKPHIKWKSSGLSASQR